MRKLTIQETELVSGGLTVGDVSFLSGNAIGSGNHVEVSNVLNDNSILNGSLNDSLNGIGVLNYSGNSLNLMT